MKRSALLAMTALMAVAGTTPAFAQEPTYQGSTFYKDPTGNVIYAGGLSYADTTASVDIGGTEITKLARADKCGVVAITFPSAAAVPTTVTLDGTALTMANATNTGAKAWKCNAATGTLTAEDAAIVPNGTTYQFLSIGPSPRQFYVYKAPQTGYTLKYTANVKKSVRINACGFATIRDDVANNMSSTTTIGLTGGSPGVALSTLATAPVAPKCTNGTLFVSGGWTF
ncbi:MAG TPA: hypothetical protein V6D12_13705 [Candidatus Obscuribacterales bacterium]